MNIALYIEDGLEQIVLTPQTDYEKKMLALLHNQQRKVEIKEGMFYHCKGGWMRHGDLGYSSYDPPGFRNENNSTILVLTEKDENENSEASQP